MRIQEYFIHLVNGDHIKIGEHYDIPCEKKLVRKFISAKPEDTLTIGVSCKERTVYETL